MRAAFSRERSGTGVVFGFGLLIVFTFCLLLSVVPLSAEAPSNADKLFREGEAALRSGDLMQAEIKFRHVVALERQSA